MRTLALTCFLFSALVSLSQSEEKEKGSLQVEIGFFGDGFVTPVSGPQMESLTGKDLPSWAPQQEPQLSEGYSSNLQAGYYTAMFQRPAKADSRHWWTAGVSFLQRTITECIFRTDSISSSFIKGPGNDSLRIYNKKSWNGVSSLFGHQLNFPIGIRFVAKDRSKRWVQAGINLAPGFTFNHKYRESHSVYTATAVADPGGPEKSHFKSVESVHENEAAQVEKVNGSYFNLYAGLPVGLCINPQQTWQFAVTFEPGYQFIKLGKAATKSAMMVRLGFGVKYVLKNS